MLDSGDARTRSEVAKRASVSANRVTNLLALLRLAPPILDAIRALPPGTPERLVTERKLRPLTGLPHGEQLQVARRFMPALVQAGKRHDRRAPHGRSPIEKWELPVRGRRVTLLECSASPMTLSPGIRPT